MPKDKEKLNKLPHYCYLITNSKNGKVYIGTTYKNINERFREHIKVSNLSDDTKKQAIHKAIAKYGKDSFLITILSEHDSANSAYDAEVNHIIQLQSTNKKYGYNQSLGGDRGPITVKHDSKVIINIITDFCNGLSLTEIVNKYNVPYHSVFDITRLKISPTHNIPQDLLNKLQSMKDKSNKKKRASSFVVAIIEDFLSGQTMQQMSDKYKFSINTIFNIIHRVSWSNINIDAELENKLFEKLSSKKSNKKHGQEDN